MSELLTQFNKEYDFIYENADRVSGFDEAVVWFDENRNTPEVQPYVTALVKERKDFIASDREAAAFAFAYEVVKELR